MDGTLVLLLGWLCAALFCSLLYFAPAMLAIARAHRNALAIAALTLLLGWTGIGWLIAFVWACTASDDRDR